MLANVEPTLRFMLENQSILNYLGGHTILSICLMQASLGISWQNMRLNLKIIFFAWTNIAIFFLPKQSEYSNWESSPFNLSSCIYSSWCKHFFGVAYCSKLIDGSCSNQTPFPKLKEYRYMLNWFGLLTKAWHIKYSKKFPIQ